MFFSVFDFKHRIRPIFCTFARNLLLKIVEWRKGLPLALEQKNKDLLIQYSLPAIVAMVFHRYII